MLDTARFNRDEKIMRITGAKLIRATNAHTTSVVCEVLGAGLGIFGSVNKSNGITIGGGLISLFGLGLNMKAWGWVGKSGILLNGTGLTVPIK